MLSEIHALHLEPMLLFLQLRQFWVLKTLQLRLISFLLQLHKLILHLKHMKSICRQKILLIFLKHMVQLAIKILNFLVSITQKLTDTSHIVEMSTLRNTWCILLTLYLNGRLFSQENKLLTLSSDFGLVRAHLSWCSVCGAWLNMADCSCKGWMINYKEWKIKLNTYHRWRRYLIKLPMTFVLKLYIYIFIL